MRELGKPVALADVNGDPDPKARGPRETPHCEADQARDGDGGEPVRSPFLLFQEC